jgi:adenylate cyclase
MAAELTLTDAARLLSVSPATLRRWVADGIVPLRDGAWSPAALAQARIVARMRHRGHSLDQLRAAAKEGRLAYGYHQDLFPSPGDGDHDLAAAARDTGLEPDLIRRIWSAAGFPQASLDHLSEDDVALLRRLAATAPRSGFRFSPPPSTTCS